LVLHRRKHGAAQAQATEKVDLELPVHLVERGVRDRSSQPVARAVDQHVDPLLAREHLLYPGLHVILVGDVDRQMLERRPAGGWRAADAEHPAALHNHPGCAGLADPRRRTADYDDNPLRHTATNPLSPSRDHSATDSGRRQTLGASPIPLPAIARGIADIEIVLLTGGYGMSRVATPT
jgi:hypothetical protein